MSEIEVHLLEARVITQENEKIAAKKAMGSFQ